MLRCSLSLAASLFVFAARASTPEGTAPPAAPPDYRYKVTTLVEDIPQPMQLKFAPDGRIFFNEYRGVLKIYHPETGEVTVAGKINVWPEQENGFLGFALDPKFSENHWIYCLYSPPDFPGQHLSRFTMQGDSLDLASEKLILQFEEQRRECCHHAGSVEFGPDGCLYFSAGDNTHPFGDSESYAPLDERPGREPWDAQKSASNTNSFNGKIIRIRVKPDATYEIPPGNLFPPGTPRTRPEIYVMGCRNPWRISIDPVTGYLYWGEVGPDANDDGPRGPRGYDEINQARRAGNFGWPYFVGPNLPYAAYNFATKELGAKFDPLHPVNNSRNNTGMRDLPPAQPAMIYWPYKDSPEFPMLGKGGRTACAGPVFHYRPAFAATDGFPAEYDNCLLFYDWQRPFIKWARLDASADLGGIEPFTAAIFNANGEAERAAVSAAVARGATVVKRVVNCVFGPDGCLYLLDYGETWGANKDARLLKISYQRGPLSPIAQAAAVPAAGREPLVTHLSSAGTHDFEAGPLQYEWRLQPGAKVLSQEANPTVTISEPGNYRAEVRVTNSHGKVGAASASLVVGNSPPTVTFDTPRDGGFYTAGQSVAYRVRVEDAEDGSSTAKPEDFAPRTLVSATLQTANGQPDVADRGFTMMKQSDCFNCHAVEQKIIGPAYVDVAEKYRGQPGALDASAQRVMSGSTGIWGPIPMLPHPQHTLDEVHTMLRWVFALEKGKGGPSMLRGLTGEIPAPRETKAGSLVLEATYTDAGRPPAGSLSGKATVTLRSRRLKAADAEVTGAKILGGGDDRVVGAVDDGHHVRFPRIDFEEVGGLTVRAASGNVGGKIEFHAGSPEGPLLCALEVPNTGGWDHWIEKTADLPARAPSTGDVYAVFVNPGKSGLMNLDWVQFNPRSTTPRQ